MSNHRVASRYAKSILELAIEQGQLEEVFADFKALEEMAKSSRELVLLMGNPVVSSEKKLKVLKALFANGSSKLTSTFFEIVSRKNREGVLMDIASEFVFQYNKFKSIQVAELTTTIAIDAEQKKQFVALVKEITGMKEVQLVEKVNPSIIGGFVLKVNDRQLDESLSSKLKALRVQFTQNHYEKQF
ncbi:ATP synthase F1 subcomplex delta subunit [Algoriphagus boseongensis]|uniref:ATP synthase subunit delta n=1 Tax=Algoriphagus boseongensis TaxID=1442587 RepID=A0A4R6T1Y4_9BACT|nr:ATP synthase F1 subunit delta [Algoriphagus boseongensis]TDQ13713.1 ATP synthase F1 subcomplex delta subunit [Algoriphagus boseongensis]